MSQQINLFNPIFLQQKKIFSSKTMAQALGVLTLGVAAMAVYGNVRVTALQRQADAGAAQLQQREARLAAVTAEFAPRQKDPLLAAEVQEAERQLGALREVSGVLQRGELGNTRGYAEYFRALARQHADGLWLTGLTINGAGSEIGVRGRALDPAAVPGYLTRLTREPILQGKGFGSLSISEGAKEGAAGMPAAAQPPSSPFIEFSLQSNSEAPRP
ncbi:PilN domain-containing protein [Massilia sp.]|uniref:PilN domain-containing protein n=1 Tax=Massilia sp. TaxID=1882437 RepID=UPI0028A0FB0D|nr:PilN domain-containing protein [Massilia sp.]